MSALCKRNDIILDIMQRPVFCWKHYVQDTGFCIRLQVEPTLEGPVERATVSRHEQQHECIFLLEPLESIPRDNGDRILSPKILFLSKRQDDEWCPRITLYTIVTNL
jgi:hypothetical protein